MRKDTPWLSSEDLLELGDVEVEISGVFHHKDAVFDSGRKEEVYSLAFKDRKKQLVLNATNRGVLVTRYGGLAKEWVGKKIVLYVQGGIRRPDGTKGNGVRIR